MTHEPSFDELFEKAKEVTFSVFKVETLDEQKVIGKRGVSYGHLALEAAKDEDEQSVAMSVLAFAYYFAQDFARAQQFANRVVAKHDDAFYSRIVLLWCYDDVQFGKLSRGTIQTGETWVDLGITLFQAGRLKKTKKKIGDLSIEAAGAFKNAWKNDDSPTQFAKYLILDSFVLPRLDQLGLKQHKNAILTAFVESPWNREELDDENRPVFDELLLEAKGTLLAG